MLLAVVAAVRRVLPEGLDCERVHLHEAVAYAECGAEVRGLPDLPLRDRRRHGREGDGVFAERMARRREQKRGVHARGVGHGRAAHAAQMAEQALMFFVQRHIVLRQNARGVKPAPSNSQISVKPAAFAASAA